MHIYVNIYVYVICTVCVRACKLYTHMEICNTLTINVADARVCLR